MAEPMLFDALPQIISLLPIIFNAMQFVFYFFFIMFYGAISMRGYKKEKPFAIRMSGTFLSGLVCLIGGLAFAGFVPFFNEGIFQLLQMDMMISGLFVSVFLAVSLYLITHKEAVLSDEDTVDKLQRKVDVLESKLGKGGKAIPESDAIRIAEKAMNGFKATRASIIGNVWEIEMEKEKRTCKVLIDAWDGEVKKKIIKFRFSDMFRDSHKIIGLVMIIALLIAVSLFFEGFPTPDAMFSSMSGMSLEDLADLSSTLDDSPFASGNLPEGCVSPLIFSNYYAELRDTDFLVEHAFYNETVKGTVEERSGETVRIMIKIEHDNKEVVMVFTDGGKACYLTENIFCGCMAGE